MRLISKRVEGVPCPLPHLLRRRRRRRQRRLQVTDAEARGMGEGRRQSRMEEDDGFEEGDEVDDSVCPLARP